MTKRKLILVVAVLAAAGVAVKLVFFREPFLYAGTLEVTKVDLSSRLSSNIAEVVPQEGDRVTNNEEVVRLVCDDTKVASDLANINNRRDQRLFKNGTISPETMDQVANQKDNADVRLSWCSIRSPLNGVVLSRYHEPGESVEPGTKLLTVADIKDIWAYIYLPQTEMYKLKPGQTLIGYLPEAGMRPFNGHILKINEEAEFTPKNVQTRAERERLVFGVKVSFLGANNDEVLKPGMTVEVALPP
jgi:membrane fusion protein YbhG